MLGFATVTPAQAKRHRKTLLREIEDGEKVRHRKALALLKEQQKDAKRRRKEQLEGTRALTRAVDAHNGDTF